MLEVPFWNDTYNVLLKVDMVAALGVTSSVIGPPEFDEFLSDSVPSLRDSK